MNTDTTRCALREVITVLCRRETARSGTSLMERRQRNSFTIRNCLGERFVFTAAASEEPALSRSTATRCYEAGWHRVDLGKRILVRFLWSFSMEGQCAR